MKKKILIILFCLILGVVLGFIFKKKVLNKEEKYNKESIYLIQVGAYENENNLVSVTKKLPFYYIKKEGELYHIYIGVLKNKEDYSYLKEFYEDYVNNIYIKEENIYDIEFVNKLDKYNDLLKTKNNNIIYYIQKELINELKEI